MKRDDLKSAMIEAQRFLRTAAHLQDAQNKADQDWIDFQESAKVKVTPPETISFHGCPREQGAVKRASMDLTRALAQLRKRY